MGTVKNTFTLFKPHLISKALPIRKKQALNKPDVKKAYDDLEKEFARLRKAVKMRQESGKNLEEDRCIRI